MLTVRKLSLATFACLVIVAAGGLYLNDSTKWKKRDTDNKKDGHTATVTAIWLPSPRYLDGVHVQVWIGGIGKVDRIFTTAPFHESYPIEPGQRAEIRITLVGDGMASTMGCAASIDNLPEHTRAKEGPKRNDSLSCWAVA